MSEFLDRQTQQKICNVIAKNPGIHISKISEILSMPLFIVKDHLRYLENKNIIFSVENDGYNKYFIDVNKRGNLDKQLNETRRKIYDLIVKNPGLHQAKIAKMLSMRKSLAEYHLNGLEKSQDIMSVKDSGYKTYYVEGSEVDSEDKKVLAIVRQQIPKNVILLLLKNPVLKHKELAEQLKISPSTLSYHLNKLMEQKIIDVKKYGEDKGYVLKSRKELMKLLVRYEIHSIIDSFEDMWDDIY